MVWVALGCAAIAGCAADGNDGEFGDGLGGGDGSGNNGNGDGGPGVNGNGDGSGNGDGGLGDDKCAETTAGADREPAIIEMVVDTSGSMGESAPGGGGTRWDVTRTALTAALDNIAAQAPETAIGLSFFPNDSKTGIFDCYFPEQTTPINQLTPQHVTALKNGFIAAGVPSGGTPTHNAYHFSATQLRASQLQGNRYMLVITDGKASYGMSDPNNPAANCTGNGSDAVDVSPLIKEVSDLFNLENIRTFVIGVPGSDDFTAQLSEMARVGGTGDSGCGLGGGPLCHFDMTTQPDLSTSLAAALADISGQALSCTYNIPKPEGDQVVDFGKVNVLYTPPGGTAGKIPRDGETGCSEGWQFSADKTQIILCGPTCDEIMEQGGSIEIEFGCTQIFG
jgi:hypothetical protein